MSKPQIYIPLRARSAYSLLKGACHIKDLVDYCEKNELPALGVTDHANLFGSLEFSQLASGKGVQPIIGITMPVAFEASTALGSNEKSENYELALYAQNEQGLKNLMALSSSAYLDIAPTEEPHLAFEKLASLNEGIIALSGGPNGPIDQLIANRKVEGAERLLRQMAEIFENRFYIELQRRGQPHQAQIENHLLRLSSKEKLPIVATNDSYFLEPERYIAHDALICIEKGRYLSEDNREKSSREFAMPDLGSMQQKFSDLPQALDATVEIARRCAVKIEPKDPLLPGFDLEKGQSETEALKALAEKGLKKRLAQIEPVAPEKDYFERLSYELEIISKMGFPGYFLIVADFIQWSKKEGVAVGPGRGSGAGSLVAYSLEITNLDPIRFGLLFERFLNPERVSMPDFDIDFCQERRGEVIRYVQNKYGIDRVAQIITFGSLQARVVVRDVGRVMQLPLGLVDRLAKLIPNNPADPTSLGQAIEIEPKIKQLAEEEDGIKELLDTALELEGLYRNASTHAAGVVIADRNLSELSPLYQDPRSDLPATQFNMKWVETAGLVKFDFLGLKTLTVIEHALRFIERNHGVAIDIDKIPLDDQATYELLAKGDTVGVFQLESSGMRDVLRKMNADCIEDIIALISLYRPGPMKNIDTYVNRKSGEEKPDYLDEKLTSVLSETHGVIIYQEQVMQIAQILSGYSLGEADLLRRAMGKKKKEEMDQQRSRFLSGAEKNGVSKEKAEYIFDLVQEFAGYGFNKSHAAAYAMIAYQTGYLKANYRAEFLAASMNLDIQNTDKLAQFVQDAKAQNIEVIPPSINDSEALFEAKDGKIHYALGAIKNVGVEAVEGICRKRNEIGRFDEISTFVKHVSPEFLNKRMVENLASAGAFDCWDTHRSQYVVGADKIVKYCTSYTNERESAQNSLFADEDSDNLEVPLPQSEKWGPSFALEEERKALGFYLSGHPLAAFLKLFEEGDYVKGEDIYDLVLSGTSGFRSIGVVKHAQKRVSSRTKKRFVFLGLSDPTGEYELFVSEERLRDAETLLKVGQKLVVDVSAKIDKGGTGAVRLFAESIRPLETVTKSGGLDAYCIEANAQFDVFELKNVIHAYVVDEIVTKAGDQDLASTSPTAQEVMQGPSTVNGRYLCILKIEIENVENEKVTAIIHIPLASAFSLEDCEKISMLTGVTSFSRGEKNNLASLSKAA